MSELHIDHSVTGRGRDSVLDRSILIMRVGHYTGNKYIPEIVRGCCPVFLTNFQVLTYLGCCLSGVTPKSCGELELEFELELTLILFQMAQKPVLRG